VLSSRAVGIFYERVVFFAAKGTPEFLRSSFRGRAIRLTRENVRAAGLATGSLPYIVVGVRDIPGAPPGLYRDGGLTDYQLNQDYRPGEGRVTLFFHYQERIVPGWLDKALKWRKPPASVTHGVLQAYPSADFVKLLPGGRIPDRNDFITFADDADERIRRWDEVSERSALLGEQFLEDVEKGRIPDLVKPMDESPR
jgi:hypothetical protein